MTPDPRFRRTDVGAGGDDCPVDARFHAHDEQPRGASAARPPLRSAMLQDPEARTIEAARQHRDRTGARSPTTH